MDVPDRPVRTSDPRPGIAAIVLSGRGPLAAFALVLICLTVYVPGLTTIPPVDRDESRFAQASRQMAESGDWVVPRIQDRPRLNKPPLSYWLQASSAWILTGGDLRRDAIWMYRVPGVLCAIATVLLTWWFGSRLFEPRSAWLAGAMLGVCPLLVFDAHQARADQALLLTVVGTQWSLWRAWSDPKSRFAHSTGLWIWLSLGILAKGPVAPMIAALTAAFMSIVGREARWLVRLRPALGVVLMGALVGPWVYAVGNQVGWSTYWQTVYGETIVRAAASREGHWGPPGYHLVLLAVLFWPGSLLAGRGLVVCLRQGLRRSGGAGPASWLRGIRPGDPSLLFCASWIIPSWLVFEAIGTKLPHYTMPMYPAIALLAAREVVRASDAIATTIPRHVGMVLWLVIGVILVVAGPIGTGMASNGLHAGPIVIACLVVSGLGVAALFAARGLVRTGEHIRGLLLALGAMIVAHATVLGLVLPRAEPLWISPRIVAWVSDQDPDLSRPIAAVGYHEDSLVFLTRGRLKRLSSGQVAEWAAAHPDGLLVLPVAMLLEHFGDVPVPRGAIVRGFNYSGAGRQELALVDLREVR